MSRPWLWTFLRVLVATGVIIWAIAAELYAVAGVVAAFAVLFVAKVLRDRPERA